MIEIEAPDESQKAYHHVERLSNLYLKHGSGVEMNRAIRKITSDDEEQKSLTLKAMALAERKLLERKRKNRLLGAGLIVFGLGLCALTYFMDGGYVVAPIGLFFCGVLLLISSARAIEGEV